jgi:hypothetical protein
MAGLIDALKSKYGAPDAKKGVFSKLAKPEDDEYTKKKKEWFEKQKEKNPRFYDESYKKNIGL